MRLLIVTLLIGGLQYAFASRPLPNARLFLKCSSQLTQVQLPPGDPILMKVVRGETDPIDACLSLLEKGRFTKDGIEIPDRNDRIARLVVSAMHRLHASFFLRRELTLGEPTDDATNEIYEGETSALYFTRALFTPNLPFQSVVTAGTHLAAHRSLGNPDVGINTGLPKDRYAFGPATPLAELGDLIGIAPVDERHLDYVVGSNKGRVNIAQHFGGGILGSPVYLLQNAARQPLILPNASDHHHRRWGEAVFSDLLCRDLPVVRAGDSSQYLNPRSIISFRTQDSCLRCHAPMDRITSVIRGFRWQTVGDRARPGMTLAEIIAPKLPIAEAWPDEPDILFYQRPPQGALFFRNSKGELVNETVSGLSDLGSALARQHDLYLCVAKRYYAYFLGVDIPIQDPADPKRKVSAFEIEQRKILARLASRLQQSQSLQGLVRDILTLPEYRRAQ